MIHLKKTNENMQAIIVFKVSNKKIKTFSREIFIDEEDINEDLIDKDYVQTYSKFWGLTILSILEDYLKENNHKIWIKILNFDYFVKLNNKIIKEWSLQYNKT